MPISTPEEWLPKYSNDKNHFKHVLDHLLLPSLEKADLDPIPPIAKGSELIHGELIRNIETAELVLCDMSILNPNVFFELGIRTALNKPVCLIKDDVTPKIPFDTTIINNHTYLNALNPWTLENEIENLANHIEESLKKSNDTNSLWKYFSLSSTAHPIESEKGIDGRIDYLTMQIEALRNQFKFTDFSSVNEEEKMLNSLIHKSLHYLCDKYNLDLRRIYISKSTDDVEIVLDRKPPIEFIKETNEIADKFGFEILIDVLEKNIGSTF